MSIDFPFGKIRGILSFGTLGLLPLIEMISETVKEEMVG
jgi:hypothetical protein